MSSKFGLGRGLAEIKQEMGVATNISVLSGAERVVVKQIPLVQIGANPDQPRKTFSDEELQDLSASIKEKGVLQPILLRAVQNRPYLYEIVAGERRYRASKLAGLAEIPALVKVLSNENAMEIALIENVQRENLNPIEEAAAYKNLMDKCGYELDDVSRLIGKSVSYIRNALRISELPNEVLEMVKSGELSASHARTIAVAENSAELAKQIVLNKLSVSDTQKLVKQGERKKGTRAYVNQSIKSDAVQEIETKISNALGVSVELRERRGGAGQIILSFVSRTQMHELIDKLTK
ncbi:MAG: ParB/RepB/Spo0J family partition protein [Alphaproteobacteria bacterium]|nr:ParB/RepB/Spo0J family partition protein [Alphaproteobacteria bacterium]